MLCPSSFVQGQGENSWELDVKAYYRHCDSIPFISISKASTVWLKSETGLFFPTPAYAETTYVGPQFADSLHLQIDHVGTAGPRTDFGIAWGKYKIVVGFAIDSPDNRFPRDSVYVDYSTTNHPYSGGHGDNNIFVRYNWSSPGIFLAKINADYQAVPADTVVAIWDRRFNEEDTPLRETQDFVPDSVHSFTVTAYPSGQHWPEIDFLSNGESFDIDYQIWRKVDNGSFSNITTFSYDESEAPPFGTALQFLDTDLAGAGYGNHLATYHIKCVKSSHDTQTTNRSIAWSYYGIGKEVAERGAPRRFDLHPNCPNPFNPSTTITYDVPSRSHIGLEIYNVHGQLVRVLAKGPHEAGRYSILWDGRDDTGRLVSSGIYLYRLATDQFVKVRKMSLVK